MKILLIILSLLVSGCAPVKILEPTNREKFYAQQNKYNEVYSKVELGQTKEEVLSILEPTLDTTLTFTTRTSDMYMEGDAKVTIYYYRTSWIMDGALTDDEFTPYTFHDDVLVGVGWRFLGGEVTKAFRDQSDKHITINRTTVKTKVE